MSSYQINTPMTRKLADKILSEHLPSKQMQIIESITERIVPSMEDKRKQIQDIYQEKIDWYKSEIEKLCKYSHSLIKQVDNDVTFNTNTFMSKAERIGIDMMNHRTIIDMLTKQYVEWFGEQPKEKTSYLDLEVL